MTSLKEPCSSDVIGYFYLSILSNTLVLTQCDYTIRQYLDIVFQLNVKFETAFSTFSWTNMCTINFRIV